MSYGNLRAGVLGAHFMKEFDWRLAYRERIVQAVRLDPSIVRGSRQQNLFFRRLKPMIRTSFNQEPWFLFLFDTGSEPTMVTELGIWRLVASRSLANARTTAGECLSALGSTFVPMTIARRKTSCAACPCPASSSAAPKSMSNCA